MMANGVRFKNGKTVKMFLELLQRGLNDKNAVMAYQVHVYQLPVESGPSQGTALGCRRLCPPLSFTNQPRSYPTLVPFTRVRPSGASMTQYHMLYQAPLAHDQARGRVHGTQAVGSRGDLHR